MRLPALLVLLVALTLAPSSSALAATPVYVDGAGTCNGLTPCFTTVQVGVSNAGPAPAEVRVFPGTYAESVDLSSMGSAIAGSPGTLSLKTVDASGVLTPGTATINAPGGLNLAAIRNATVFAGDITIDGFTVDSASGDGIALVANGAVDIANVVADAVGDGSSADDTGDDGISITMAVSGHPIALTNCTANNDGGRFADGFEIASLVPGTDVTITKCSANNNVGIEDNDGFDIIDAADVAISDCVAIGNSNRGFWLDNVAKADIINSSALLNGGAGFDVSPFSNLSVQRITSAGNGGDGLTVGTGGASQQDHVSVLASVFIGNEGVGIRLARLDGAFSQVVQGSLLCGNVAGGLQLAKNVTVDAEENIWGQLSGPTHPSNAGGTGQSVIDGANGGVGTVDFSPFFDVITADIPSLTTGVPAMIGFSLAATGGMGTIGDGPGDPNGFAPFILATDNGTLTSSQDTGAVVTEFINAPNDTVQATLTTAVDGSVTVTFSFACGITGPGGGEDCTNCIDDDGDGLVDRDDPDCGTRANGAGAGLNDPKGTGKAVNKCVAAIQKGGAKLASAKLKKLDTCLNAVFACLQQKPNDAACIAKAKAKCDAQLAKIPADETKLDATTKKACAASLVTADDLLAPTGLGYASELRLCKAVGVLTVTSIDDVALCVQRRHECRVEELLAMEVPRAAELLSLAGHDAATEFPCMPAVTLPDGGGVDDADRGKALVKCEKGLKSAGAKYVAGRQKVTQKCETSVQKCIQLKPGDAACMQKASDGCQKVLAKLTGAGGLTAKLTDGVAKACATVPMDDLVGAAGLGFAERSDECEALGISPLNTIQKVSACLTLEHDCRADQLLESETPRLVELLTLGGGN